MMKSSHKYSGNESRRRQKKQKIRVKYKKRIGDAEKSKIYVKKLRLNRWKSLFTYILLLLVLATALYGITRVAKEQTLQRKLFRDDLNY